MSAVPGVPVDVLRERVRQAVEVHGVRRVAAAIGMTHPGLLSFLDGSAPRAQTRQKLLKWYVEQATGAGTVDRMAVEAALALLLTAVPHDKRARVAERVWECLAEAYRETGEDVPAWLEGLPD